MVPISKKNWIFCAGILCLGFLCLPTSAQAQLLTGFRKDGEGTKLQPLFEVEQPSTLLSPSQINPGLLSPRRGTGAGDTTQEPVDLQADNLSYDDQNQIITATGDVFLVQAGRILRADKIVYDLKSDRATASGYVVLNEMNGDVHLSDEVVLEDNMKDGFIVGLKSYLNDGSRFTAEEGQRTDGNKTTMHAASYTPCDPCESNPEEDPVWQIKAAEVNHDEEEARISYKHARFEAFGVPIMYLPYFSHPDGTVEQKSGFLSPSFGFKSDQGIFIENNYYWAIAPDKDLTMGVIAYSDENPLGLMQYRQRWDDAEFEFNGGVTYSERRDRFAGVTVTRDEEVRGHVLANGLWDLNEKWRTGLDIEWASDDQYMREYDFSNDNVLTNQLYIERFSGRNYSAGRLLTFQDIRVREDQEDQPEVLPEIVTSFIAEPGSMPYLGGRLDFEGSFLGLRRDGNDQDLNRLSTDIGWQRRMVSDYGLVADIDADMRLDLYNVRDREIAGAAAGDVTEARFFPQGHAQVSYPMARSFDSMQARIEPVASLTLAPNIDTDDDIPNEDSQDVQIDTSNLFDPNRFPGYDRVEDQSRATYGLRTGLYGYGGSQGTVFLGQSYRLSDDDNPFPVGSGLDGQNSDVVGDVSVRYKDQYGLEYRFQLDKNSLDSQRNEVTAFADWNRLRLNANYLFARGLEGTDIEESREQLSTDAQLYFTEEWGMRAGATQDFGEAPGLRQAYATLDYYGQCVSWSLQGQRNLTIDAAGESDFELVFRIGLKNLGEFQKSGYRKDGGAL